MNTFPFIFHFPVPYLKTIRKARHELKKFFYYQGRWKKNVNGRKLTVTLQERGSETRIFIMTRAKSFVMYEDIQKGQTN